MLERKIENRQLINIIVLFTIVQFAGLLITIFAFSSVEVYAAPMPASASVSGAAIYLAYIVTTAIIIILLFRFVRGDILFVLLEGFVVLFATSFLLFIILTTLLPSTSYLYIGIACVLATILLIVAKNYRPGLRNFIAITSSIGVGVVIGQNGFYLAYLLMLFIAVYDYVAVFITKHMITLARAVSARNLAFLIGSSDVEAIPKEYVTAKDRAEFKKSVKMKDVKDPTMRELIAQGAVPVISQVQLGTGDLAIPLMLSVSAYVSFFNYMLPVSIVIGSIFGLIFTMYLLKTYRVALPAIPPLFAFINLFLGVVFLFAQPQNYSLALGFRLGFVITLTILMAKLNRIRGEEGAKPRGRSLNRPQRFINH